MATSYETILNKYKTKREVLDKVLPSTNPELQTKQKDSESFQSKSSSSPSYLNFLEKQVEKANSAYSQVSALSSGLSDLCQRVELLELGQQDLIKKFKIIESVSFGFSDEQAGVRKLLEAVATRVQLLEAEGKGEDWGRMKAVNEQVSQKLDTSFQNMEFRINDLLQKEMDSYLQVRDANLENKLIALIDKQGQDIALDYSQLDRQIQEICQLLANGRPSLDAENLNPNGSGHLNKEQQQLEEKVEKLKREVEGLKRKVRQEGQEVEKKMREMARGQGEAREFKKLEEKLNRKISRAIDQLTSVSFQISSFQIIKQQDNKVSVLFNDESQSRMHKSVSPRGSQRNKSQQSLSATNNSMVLKGLSPIRQDMGTEKNLSLSRDQESVSAFRRYKQQFGAPEQKFIRSGSKDVYSEVRNQYFKRNDSSKDRSTALRSQKAQQEFIKTLNQSGEKIQRECCVEKRKAQERQSSKKSESRSKSRKKTGSKGDKVRTLQQSSEKHRHFSSQKQVTTQTLNPSEARGNLETVLISLYPAQPKFDLDQNSSSQHAPFHHNSNLTDQNDYNSRVQDYGTINTSMDKQTEMRRTNERLAKLERMYEELQVLENRARGK